MIKHENVKQNIKSIKIKTKPFKLPFMTDFKALKPYLTCLCGNPQWYAIYHVGQCEVSAKCAHCMRSLTKKQYLEANELMLTRQQLEVNEVPVDTTVKVSNHNHTDYKLEEMEGIPDIAPKYQQSKKTFKNLVMDIKAKTPTPAQPEGLKFDKHKIRTSLLKRFGLALLAIAELGTRGAEKYTDHSWTHVSNGVTRYDDALLGHYLREMFEPEDLEMKVPHEVSTAWNALAKLQLLIDRDSEWKSRLMQRNME